MVRAARPETQQCPRYPTKSREGTNRKETYPMTSTTPAETPDTREHDHSTGIPLFAPDAQLEVQAVDGPQSWSGAEWNEYVTAAARAGSGVAERLIACPEAVCSTACPDRIVKPERGVR